MNKPLYISIEGNIGSGKTTIMNALRTVCNESEIGQHVVFIDEQVSEWIKPFDNEGKSIIDLFYSDPSRYCLTFQLKVLMDQYNALKSKI